MLVLVCYDIGDVAGAGAGRLRRVAEACKDHGVRVQFSVFECRLNEAQWIRLRHELLTLIDHTIDSLRFYFVCEADQKKAELHGQVRGTDPTSALIF